MKFLDMNDDFFNELMKRLEEIQKKLESLGSEPEELWMDNDQACSYMNVSKRTLQSYRDRNLIQYSQYGSKIWYKFDWIREFLEKHKKP